MRICSIVLVGLLLAAVGAAQESLPARKVTPEKLESRLLTHAERALRSGEGSVSVVLEREKARAQVIEAFGAQIEARSAHFVRVRLPTHVLLEVADALGTFLRLPLRPWKAKIEGLEVTGASVLHEQGLGGQGVRLAVIDVGFSGLSAAIAAGRIANVLLQKDYTRLGMEGDDESHGTDVTEILYAMAPQAEFLLYRIADEVDLENAVDDALRRGAQIINHSVGWVNTEFGDGTGIISQIAQDAVRRGVVWVNAAGNEAQRHWMGPWQDLDGDGWLNVSGQREWLTLEAEAGDSIEVFLTWDEWPRSRTDYDLYLLYDLNGDGQLDPDTEIVASSTSRQSGAQPPTESIEYVVPVPGHYEVAVAGPPGAAGHRLKLFSFNHDLTPAVAAGSLLAPAAAPDVIAVGAVDYREYTSGTIEPFSSQGPTSDGRIKPDLVAPDGVLVSSGRFFGTSAAAPVVAGAAALLLSREPALTAAQLRTRLLAQTRDFGPAGPDSVFGAGGVLLQAQGPAPTSVPRPGDVTGDGRLDKADLKLLRAYLRGRASFTPAQAAAADVAAPCGPPYDRTTITKQDYKTLRRAFTSRKPVTSECSSPISAQQLDAATVQFALVGRAVWQVEVFSLSGRSVFRSDWATGTWMLWDTSALANGVYLYVVKVQTPNGRIVKSEVRKLVVKH